jgi:hypothetical protein
MTDCVLTNAEARQVIRKLLALDNERIRTPSVLPAHFWDVARILHSPGFRNFFANFSLFEGRTAAQLYDTVLMFTVLQEKGVTIRQISEFMTAHSPQKVDDWVARGMPIDELHSGGLLGLPADEVKPKTKKGHMEDASRSPPMPPVGGGRVNSLFRLTGGFGRVESIRMDRAVCPGSNVPPDGVASMLPSAVSYRWVFLLLSGLTVSIAGAGQPPLPPRPIGEGKGAGWMSVEPRKTTPGDDELRKLLVARYNAALAELKIRTQELLTGRLDVVTLSEVARHLLDAELELATKPAEQLLAHERALEYAHSIEDIAQAKFQAGTAKPADVERAHYYALDAEIQLLKTRRKADKAK